VVSGFSCFLAPGMGGTGVAKKTVGLVAQVSAVSFFVAVVSLFCMLGHKVFTQKSSRPAKRNERLRKSN
jgi:hypothetical protein